jgi:hypothetical protein
VSLSLSLICFDLYKRIFNLEITQFHFVHRKFNLPQSKFLVQIYLQVLGRYENVRGSKIHDIIGEFLPDGVLPH